MERQEIFTSLKKLIEEKFSEGIVTPTMYCPEKLERRMSFDILDKVDTPTGKGLYKRFTITLQDNTPINY